MVNSVHYAGDMVSTHSLHMGHGEQCSLCRGHGEQCSLCRGHGEYTFTMQSEYMFSIHGTW